MIFQLKKMLNQVRTPQRPKSVHRRKVQTITVITIIQNQFFT
jgi:hypothetical protein